MVWRTQMGDIGRIQTAQLARKVAAKCVPLFTYMMLQPPEYANAHFEIIDMPSKVFVYSVMTIVPYIVSGQYWGGVYSDSYRHQFFKHEIGYLPSASKL